MGSHFYGYFYGHGGINERLFLFINHATSPFLDAVMPAVTLLGGPPMFPCYLALVALVFLSKRETMPGRYLTAYILAFLLSFMMEELLKGLFRVPRPPVAIGPGRVRLLEHVSSSYSLPSGHAIFSFMTATVLSYGRRIRWKIPLFVFACLVAWSRVYVGAHYPLDVLAGATVGAGCALAVWKGYERRKRGG